MKFKLLCYFLAASIMSSVQAVTIINMSFGVMILNGFGYQMDDGDMVVEEVPMKIYSGEQFSTEKAWNNSYQLMTVRIYQKTYFFRNLTSETVVIFRDGDNYDVTYQRTESPFCPEPDESFIVVNNTLGEIVLSEFVGKNVNYARQQIERKPLVLAPGDKIELSCRSCRIDRMHITGSPYCLKQGIFQDLNEFKDFPSAIIPALSSVKKITFFEFGSGNVKHKKSKTAVASCMDALLVVVNNTSIKITLCDFAGKDVNHARQQIKRKPVVLEPGDKIGFCDSNCTIDLITITAEQLYSISDLADIKRLILTQDEEGMIIFEIIKDLFDIRRKPPK